MLPPARVAVIAPPPNSHPSPLLLLPPTGGNETPPRSRVRAPPSPRRRPRSLRPSPWTMAQQEVGPQSSKVSEPFEYVVYEDTGRSEEQVNPWIDPNSLKLSHRIGRGPFGDVWLATHHLSTEDYDEYHEVAIKMLPYMQEDQRSAILSRFQETFYKCQSVEGVCFLHGVTVKNDKICIVMKFHEGSLGDRLARLDGGGFPLSDILRYGLEVVQSILGLHSREVLALNLKPCNVLINDADQAILGEFGIPSLLHGISPPNKNIVWRLGTPNYMAPEQWQPEIRGPISYETDSWGLGCSIVEMLTGVQPWSGKSANDIYQLVVLKKEKPSIPSGLPPRIATILRGCFQYDPRNRPTMRDILEAFKSDKSTSQDATIKWMTRNNCTDWSLVKDTLQVGDVVRSRKSRKTSKPENMTIPEGTVVGVEGNGFVLVRVHGIHDPQRIHSSTLERVSHGFATGDWVKIKGKQVDSSPVGILHSIDRDGNVTAGFRGKATLWNGHHSELQMAEPFCKGQFIRLKSGLSDPTFEWPTKDGGAWATGRISQILPNGCLAVKFPGRLVFGDSKEYLADPAEAEAVTFATCEGMVSKYQHLEDFHWAVRPLVIALGFFAALKVGAAVGKGVLRSPKNEGQDERQQEGQTGGSGPGWLQSNVANILFREGGSGGTSTGR